MEYHIDQLQIESNSNENSNMEDLNREKLTGWKKLLARRDFFIYTALLSYGVFLIFGFILAFVEFVTKQENLGDRSFGSAIFSIFCYGYLILFAILFSLRLWIFFKCATNWKCFIKRHIYGCLCLVNIVLLLFKDLFHWGNKITGNSIVDFAIILSGFIIAVIIVLIRFIHDEYFNGEQNKDELIEDEEGEQELNLWLYGRQYGILYLNQYLMGSYYTLFCSFGTILLLFAIIWCFFLHIIESGTSVLSLIFLSGLTISVIYLWNIASLKVWCWSHPNDERIKDIEQFLIGVSLTNFYGGVVPSWRIWINRLAWGIIIGLSIYFSFLPDKSIGKLEEYAQEEFCKEMQYMDERTAISEEIDYYKAPSFSTSEHIASLTGKQVIHICNRVKDYDEKKDFVHYGPSSFKKILKMNDIKEYAVDHPDDIVAELFYFDAQFTHFGNGYSSEHAYVLVCPDIPTTNQKFRSQVLSYTYEDFVKEVLN